MAAEAASLEQHATDLDALNATPSSAKELWQGFGATARALRTGGLSSLTAKLRSRAMALREQAKTIGTAPNRHDGPKLTAYKRRMAPIWEQEMREEEARRAAVIAAERQREAEKAEQARKAQEAREAAHRAAERERARKGQTERYAAITLPLVQRARKDPDFARRIGRWGISLDRPDHNAARDDIWCMQGKGYDGKLIWAILTDEAKAKDRQVRQAEEQKKADAEAQHRANVEAFQAKQVERADSFPTPKRRWPFPQFRALEPSSIQTAFNSRYRGRLTKDETTQTIRAMTARWISRIVEDLHAIKPMRSIWSALTGGNAMLQRR